MAKYIHSTSSTNMVYPIYDKSEGNVRKELKRIVIKGGANVIDKKTLNIKFGEVTKVSDEDYELLKEDPAFKRHCDRHFITVQDSPELNISDMEKADNSAQMTEETHALKGGAPSTKASTKESEALARLNGNA